jgi:hypothetical protein
MNFIGFMILFIVVVIAAGQFYKSKTGELPAWKYFQPFSVTYWSTLIPAIVGILISGEPLTGWVDLSASLAIATGGVDPQILIAGSLAGIGLTGKGK